MKRRIANGMMKKDGTVATRYEWIVSRVMYSIRNNGKSDRFHCKSWTGSNRHRQLEDNERKFRDVLEALGIGYTAGNDAPRGGIEGDYIEARYDGRNVAVKAVRASKPAGLEEDVALFNGLTGGKA